MEKIKETYIYIIIQYIHMYCYYITTMFKGNIIDLFHGKIFIEEGSLVLFPQLRGNSWRLRECGGGSA